MDIKITPDDYRKQDWIIHRLASDFKLIDCWRLPIRSSQQFKDDLSRFLKIDPVNSHPVAKALFKLRIAIGKIFRLDQKSGSIPKTGERSISQRLGNEKVELFQMPQGSSFKNFHPVYATNGEALIELSNSTIYALIHLGKVSDEIWMGIYIKPYGVLSDLYMMAIKPFRHYIFYPLWLKHLQREWQKGDLANPEIRK